MREYIERQRESEEGDKMNKTQELKLNALKQNEIFFF